MKKALALCLLLIAMGCGRNRTESESASKAAQVSSVPSRLVWPSTEVQDFGSAAELPQCRPSTPTLTPDSLGPIATGMKLPQVLERCPGAKPFWDWGTEGIPEPALAIRLGDAVVRVLLTDTLRASVHRIETMDANVRTPEGIGVGSTVVEATAAYGEGKAIEGECAVFLTFQRLPNTSFHLRFPDNIKHECGTFESGNRKPPANATIHRMFIYGSVTPGTSK